MNKHQKRELTLLAVGILLLLTAVIFPVDILSNTMGKYLRTLLFLIPYLIVGGGVLLEAAHNMANGQIFDENFLMSVSTIGAFCLGEYTEAVAVMLFYRVGELFQNIAVDRSRRSIAGLMELRPDVAYIETDDGITAVGPEVLQPGDVFIVRPGERVACDGIVEDGVSSLDTSAITGESMPRDVCPGDEIISGCVNMSGLLRVRTTKLYTESTVSRILELVEAAGDKKARTENFITRFARYYTPAVCAAALLLALIPPIFVGNWADWIQRGLIFLVVSCPCALVISVPMSFFGGIAGASRHGILIKGGNYLETLASVRTVVFDKTGTLTSGAFAVSEVRPHDISGEKLIELAAYAESASTHPIARSVAAHFGGQIDTSRISFVTEVPGGGVRACVDGDIVLAGNSRFLRSQGIEFPGNDMTGSVISLALCGKYAGSISFIDTVKHDSASAVESLKGLGVRRIVMLTGDKNSAAERTAEELGIDEFTAELLPEQKAEQLEKIMNQNHSGSVVFVGDGINDAPVLAAADVGIAMGAVGSDAAIEAADVVIMDDNPSAIALSVRIARKTMSIVYQNIIIALGIKGLVLILAAFSLANMWLAVFADVGVSVLAIFNAMRCMRIK